jgi:integrase/recombinase XerC
VNARAAQDQSILPRSELQAVQVLLDKLGLTPGDLLTTSPAREMPTLADYIPRVAKAVSDSTRRVYGSYWNLVVREWGHRSLDEITPLEIGSLCEQAKSSAVQRRNTRGGRGAAEHLIGALRCVYNFAVTEGLIAESQNPATLVSKPRRLPSTRHALPDRRIEELSQVAAQTGNDPELDTLLLRLHLETACRRGGALALTADDLDPEHCVIRLREKGGTVRWQPVSPTLMSHLLAHWETRGMGDPRQQLLRYATGKPITTRRYDHLWQRLGRHLPWVATQQITAHWLRHTTLTWVERNFGFAVAQAYAGHFDSSRDPGATATYIRAGLPEVATALAALTGEPHPLV